MSILLLALALLPVLLYVFRKPILKLLTPQGIPGIPAYPDPLPFFGDLKRFGAAVDTTGGPQPFLDQLARDLGPLAQVRLSFIGNMVVLTDYASIENLLTKHSHSLERSTFTGNLFQGILPTAQISLPTNEMWKHHRRIIGTSMTSKYLSLTTPRANESIATLISYWKLKGEKAGPRAFQADGDMENATMDAICGMAFGSNWGILQSFKDQISKYEPETGELGEALFPVDKPEMLQSVMYLFDNLPLKTVLPKIYHFFLSKTPTWRRHHKKLSRYLDEKLVKAREKAKIQGADASLELADNTLDLMVARELRGEDWMPDLEMKDEIYQYLLAGTETSGTTLSWWVKYMTNHPEVQVKLRKHLLEVLPELQDRQPTFEDLNAIKTPYLEAVVHEALRLSRTASGYGRDVIEDIVVLGRRIPKGTILIIPTVTGWEDRNAPTYSDSFSTTSSPSSSSNVSSAESSDNEDEAVRRNDNLEKLRTDGATRKVGYWAKGSAMVFDPERWLDAQGKFDINAGPSLPFSLGQRACFGKNLALLEMRLFMAQLNQAFFFAPVAENQNSFVRYETITTHPRQSFIRPVSWDSTEAKAAEGA